MGRPESSKSVGDVATWVRAVLARPDSDLDYARAKLALDRIVDPSVDVDAVLAELDRMAATAADLAGPDADEAARLAALRRLIYESGPWNDYRPFAYDHSNVQGANVRIKLLSHYLETRLGDCVSMPVLFLILAERLGLHVALAQAPNHVFVRHISANGHTNFETTSGANPARDEWLRQLRPMTAKAIENGLYLRTLPRREGVAVMAMTVLQHCMDSHRYLNAIAVSQAILESHPRDGLVLANQANAYFHLIGEEFLDQYPTSFLIPLHRQPRYCFLRARNRLALIAAEALGWEPAPETRMIPAFRNQRAQAA